MIRIVLVDDQELVRAGLRALAESEGDIAVVGEAALGDGERAAEPRLCELDRQRRRSGQEPHLLTGQHERGRGLRPSTGVSVQRNARGGVGMVRESARPVIEMSHFL